MRTVTAIVTQVTARAAAAQAGRGTARALRVAPGAARRVCTILGGYALVLLAGVPALAQRTLPTPIPIGPATSARDTLRLTLADAREIAVRANLELSAARLDIAIAQGQLRQAGVFRYNPAGDVLAGGRGAAVGVSQELEVAGQRGARRAAGTAGLERATAGVVDAARLTIGSVDRAFYQLAAATRRLSLAEEVLGLNQRLADAAARQLSAGEISKFEFNLAIVESGRAQARAIAARRARLDASSQLARLLAVPTVTALAPVVPLAAGMDSAALENRVGVAAAAPLDVDSLVQVALARRPDVAERAAGVREANARATVARREAYPNLIVRASSERLEGSDTRALRPGIGLSLPVFNRNQGEVDARTAAARQADLQRGALVARIRADVGRIAASVESAAAETNILARTVLVPARENRRLLEIAYREGKVGLPVLLLIRNQVIDAELEYWTAWLTEREARADLAEATGETVIGFDARTVPATRP